MTNVTVYIPINTTIDPSGVQVFGEMVTTSDRIINCEVTIDVANILPVFRYQEDPTNRDNVVVTTVPSNDSGFVSDLSGTLNGLADLDLSSYSWWPALSSAPYYGNSTNAMYHYTSVYEVLLSQIAYDLFGHPLAKAGIANDVEILSYFQQQNLARMLTNDLESLSSSALRVVYQQMVEQAPLRFNHQDSAAGTTGAGDPLPVALPFQEGDTIRFEVTLAGYNVTSFGTSVDTTSTGYSVSKNQGLISTSNGPVTYTLNVNIGAETKQSVINKSFTFPYDVNDNDAKKLTLSSNTNLPLGNDSYTIELWVKINPAVDTLSGGFVGWGNVSGPLDSQIFAFDSSHLSVYWGAQGNGQFSISTPLCDNTWHHVVSQYDGTTRSVYLDGTLVGSDVPGYTPTVSDYSSFVIAGGALGGAVDAFRGKMTNLRIVKGLAVYSGNFTVPTSPLTAVQSAGTNISAITSGQTVLLLNVFDTNLFADSSSYSYTMAYNSQNMISTDTPFTSSGPNGGDSGPAPGG